MTRSSPLTKASPDASAIRVLIVDDSAVIRGLMSRWLKAEDDLELVGAAADGEHGVTQARLLAPDVIVLDVEMPRLDGLAALPKLKAAAPNAKVVMSSGLTRRNAEVTVKALAQGATDYITKPSAAATSAPEFQRDLIAKIRALGTATARTPAPKPSQATRPEPSRRRPEAIFLGASTGGPCALRTVLAALDGVSAPVFITQHMPPAFTTILAEQLDGVSARSVVEAAHGMPVEPGRGYVAPGGHHMTVRRASQGLVTMLDQEPPEHFCRPAVDPLFRSAAATYGTAALGVVLTGMGRDGEAGSAAVVRAGGTVLAQDADSSAVWGMPGAVEGAGLAALLGPPDRLGAAIVNLTKGRAP